MLDSKLIYEEIPQGVHDDLAEHFETVIYAIGSPVTENSTAMKSNYMERGEELQEFEVLEDNITNKLVKVRGYEAFGFIIRGDVDKDTIIVRAVVVTMGILPE
jgi:translation initiation factor 2 alpha subunit (eIF-2alpha)